MGVVVQFPLERTNKRYKVVDPGLSIYEEGEILHIREIADDAELFDISLADYMDEMLLEEQ